ncbi:MAG: AAA family ATPase [Paludibacteraceae bacterium]
MIKIAIIGPESTGKSDLSKALATYFDCPWEPELARHYIENLNRSYTYDDVTEIARLQVKQEEKYQNNDSEHKYVFFDTELIITKVWFEHKYGIVPDFLNERLDVRFFDFYLLCAPDIPWEYDPVRENSDKRDFFFNWYEKEINESATPYAIINGIGKKRLQHAIEAIKQLERQRDEEKRI